MDEKRNPLLYFVILSLGLTTRLIAQPPPPQCTPPPPLQTLAIPFRGLTSGCTNATGALPCRAGETVEFKVGDGIRQTDCPTEYLWRFETANVQGSATMTHQFTEPGTFTVTLRITDRFGTTNLSQPVTVAANVPTLSETALFILMMTILTIAVVRLR